MSDKGITDFLKSFFGRRHRSLPGMDGKFYCTSECDGCGECYRRCPTGHIKMLDGKPYWPKPCLMCAACADVCPSGAIRYGNPDK